MGDNTKIEWADKTFNPWVGCTKVSPACDHCYAEGWGKRSGMAKWGPNEDRVRTSAYNWKQPIKWDKEAARLGVRYRVFCASLADVFDLTVETDWRRDLFSLIKRTPSLDWLLLTKRIGNARALLNECAFGQWDSTPLPNVWLGATICNQEEADRDIPKLLQTPAAVRFLSVEPLLGLVTLNPWLLAEHGRRHIGAHPGIGWVIVGGESGPGARPMHPDWVRRLRDQCVNAGVPFMFKQWGEWRPAKDAEEYNTARGMAQRVPALIVAQDGTTHCFMNDYIENDWCAMRRVGKKNAGRLLDGREWNEVPK